MPAAKAGESINSPTFVRQALGPLRRCVRDLDLVTAFSMHPPKARSSDFRDLLQASQAFSAIPRVGLLFAWHPDDAELPEHERRRVLIRGKGNTARNPGALEFRVVGKPYMHDDGRETEREVVTDVKPCSVTIADLAPDRVVGRPHEPTKTGRATAMLLELLADKEWHLAAEIQAPLDEHGIGGASVVREAKRKARVKTRKQPGDGHGPWEWRIQTAPEDALTPWPAARASSPAQNALTKTGQNPNNDGKASRHPGSELNDRPAQGVPAPEEVRARTREAGVGVPSAYDPFSEWA
jgi:hypothetical protein